MEAETRIGILRLMMIVMLAMAFMVMLSISLTAGVLLAEAIDPAQGLVWSGIFWASLFGGIIATTYVIRRLFSLF